MYSVCTVEYNANLKICLRGTYYVAKGLVQIRYTPYCMYYNHRSLVSECCTIIISTCINSNVIITLFHIPMYT